MTQVQCRECKRVTQKTPLRWEGLYRKQVYVDERGKRWNGRRCPNCETKRVNAYKLKQAQQEVTQS